MFLRDKTQLTWCNVRSGHQYSVVQTVCCDKKIKVASVKSQCDSSTLLLKFVIMLRLTVCYSHAVRYVDLSCEALRLSILNLVLHITSINTFALFYRKLPYTDIRDVNLSCAVVLWYEIDCRGLFQRTASW